MIRRKLSTLAPSNHLIVFRKLLIWASLIITLFAVAPTRVFAEDEPEVYDARLQGYTQTVQLDIASTALTWIVLIVLGGLCLGVLFKDPKRSHLD